MTLCVWLGTPQRQRKCLAVLSRLKMWTECTDLLSPLSPFPCRMVSKHTPDWPLVLQLCQYLQSDYHAPRDDFAHLCSILSVSILMLSSWRTISFSFVAHTKFSRGTFPVDVKSYQLIPFSGHLRAESKWRSKVTEKRSAWMYCSSHSCSALVFQENLSETSRSSPNSVCGSTSHCHHLTQETKLPQFTHGKGHLWKFSFGPGV